MTIVIEIYMVVCALLLLFDLCFLAVKNSKNQRLQPKNGDFADELYSEIQCYRETGAFSASFVQELSKKLAKTKNMITLQNILEEKNEAIDWFRPFLLEQLSNYEAKTDYEQAFYTYMISRLDFKEERVPADFAGRMIGFLDSKSLYTFTNTMMAMYAFGESHLLLQAMEKVDARGSFYHKKLLVDGLLTYQGNFEELNQLLLERFDGYTPYIQDCLLDYFRLQEYDVSDLCLRLIREEKADLEVQYRAMRYFHKFHNTEARELMLELLRKEDASWVKQMLAIQGLKGYDDAETSNVIRRKIISRSWYVRINAIEYFHQKGLSRQELHDILYLKDKYTNEALLYQYRNDEKTSAYILRIINDLAEEDVAQDTAEGSEVPVGYMALA